MVFIFIIQKDKTTAVILKKIKPPQLF